MEGGVVRRRRHFPKVRAEGGPPATDGVEKTCPGGFLYGEDPRKSDTPYTLHNVFVKINKKNVFVGKQISEQINVQS